MHAENTSMVHATDRACCLTSQPTACAPMKEGEERPRTYTPVAQRMVGGTGGWRHRPSSAQDQVRSHLRQHAATGSRPEVELVWNTISVHKKKTEIVPACLGGGGIPSQVPRNSEKRIEISCGWPQASCQEPPCHGHSSGPGAQPGLSPAATRHSHISQHAGIDLLQLPPQVRSQRERQLKARHSLALMAGGACQGCLVGPTASAAWGGGCRGCPVGCLVSSTPTRRRWCGAACWPGSCAWFR